ncbi:MAG TPA: hypothetical protein VGO68_11070 [Pyrinomonadaceae bacterium]|jgi:hypothetical protein|nr:hypothetical protein [Pyrinomonadaceae bacterium]
MNRSLSIMALVLTAALADGALGAAAQQSEEAGHVVEIRCDAFLKKPNAPDQRQLNAKREKGLKLYALDKLKCAGEGYLKLEIYGRPYSLNQSHGWYPIPERFTGDDSAPSAGRKAELKGTLRLFLAETRNADTLATEQVSSLTSAHYFSSHRWKWQATAVARASPSQRGCCPSISVQPPRDGAVTS